MQKKLIALAIAGLSSTAAFAQSNVTIYGTLRPSYDFVNVKTNGVETAGVRNMNSNSSIIGFKGSEDLGNGLKAIFQLEYNVDPATENSTIGSTGTQDMFIGLDSKSLGSIKFGALNNALKKTFGGYDMFSFSIGDYNNIFTQGVDSRNSGAAYYQSPTWSGFTLHASYALDGVQDSKVPARSDITKTSIAGDYKWGGLQLTAGLSTGEISGTTANARTTRYGAAYTFSSKTKILAVYGNDQQFKGRVDQDNWMIGVAQPVTTNLTLMADYIKAQDDKKKAGDQGATNWNLGAKYALSKRTNVQALYSYIKNESAGVASFDSSSLYGVVGGSKATAISLRMQHSF